MVSTVVVPVSVDVAVVSTTGSITTSGVVVPVVSVVSVFPTVGVVSVVVGVSVTTGTVVVELPSDVAVMDGAGWPSLHTPGAVTVRLFETLRQYGSPVNSS